MDLNGVDFEGFSASLCQEFGIEKSAAPAHMNKGIRADKWDAKRKILKDAILDRDAAKLKSKIKWGSTSPLGKGLHYAKSFGKPALALGAAGLLGKVVYDQYKENQMPLSQQLNDPRTALGHTAGVVQGGGQLALAATMANEMIRSRQGEQYI